ncbi:hypothetical protein CaCOL14_011784 [Colletotrichum acutatum]
MYINHVLRVSTRSSGTHHLNTTILLQSLPSIELLSHFTLLTNNLFSLFLKMLLKSLGLLFLASVSVADLHSYCACQFGRDKPIDFETTKKVAEDPCSNPFTWAPIVYQPHQALTWAATDRVRWRGSYLQCASGEKCIDGDDFVRQCRKFNPNADGACVECPGWPSQSGNGEIICN